MARPPVLPAEDKTRIVLSILAGEVTVAEAARRAKVSEQAVGTWKRQFLDAGRAGLVAGKRGPSTREAQLEAETVRQGPEVDRADAGRAATGCVADGISIAGPRLCGDLGHRLPGGGAHLSPSRFSSATLPARFSRKALSRSLASGLVWVKEAIRLSTKRPSSELMSWMRGRAWMTA